VIGGWKQNARTLSFSGRQGWLHFFSHSQRCGKNHKITSNLRILEALYLIYGDFISKVFIGKVIICKVFIKIVISWSGPGRLGGAASWSHVWTFQVINLYSLPVTDGNPPNIARNKVLVG
jgi:hypothetical protein